MMILVNECVHDASKSSSLVVGLSGQSERISAGRSHTVANHASSNLPAARLTPYFDNQINGNSEI